MFEEERLKIEAVLRKIEVQEKQIEKQRIKELKKVYRWFKLKAFLHKIKG